MASLLLAATIVVLFVVWVSTNQFAEAQIKKELQTGFHVLESALSTREKLLTRATKVLTDDINLRKAIGSGDDDSTTRLLENHGNRINADFIAILNVDGVIETSVGSEITKNYFQDAAQQALKDGVVITITPANEYLYQFMLVTVNAPKPIAIAVIGLKIDQTVAKELQQITGLDISLIWNHVIEPSNHGLSGNIQTTLKSVDQKTLQNTLSIPSWRLPFSYPQDYQSTIYPLNHTNTAFVYLSVNLHEVFPRFDRLLINICFLSAIAITMALLAALLFSQRLTTPLHRLSDTAKSIASGNYSSPIHSSTNIHEMKQLALTISSMQNNISQREKQINYRATHDIATGLINRSSFTETVAQYLQKKAIFQLVGFSLHNIRKINNVFGPAIGQRCLKKISDHLSTRFICAARSSDERFMAIVEHHLTIEDISNIHKMLKFQLQHSLEEDGIHINAEIFVTSLPYDSNHRDVDALIRKLDITMDANCTAGNEISVYEEGQEESYLEHLQIVEDLRLSIKNKGSDLAMFYQPKLDLQTGKITKMEALIRWQHNTKGFIPPDVFIPLAEQSGLINILTEWIIENVIQQLAKWLTQGHRFQVAINLSAQDIARKDMLIIINKLLLDYQVPASALSFEITESEIMAHPEEAIRLLSQFREQSFKLAIDDFGTGYSSLAQLKNMPVTDLKIDREFVMKLADTPDDQIIVQSTIKLANSFNLGVIAEGVENVESLSLLANWGCQWAQGYFIARPMSADSIVDWLNEFYENNTYQVKNNLEQ